MAPILKSVVAQVSREGRSVLSRRSFSSGPYCSKCGRRESEGETVSVDGWKDALAVVSTKAAVTAAAVAVSPKAF